MWIVLDTKIEKDLYLTFARISSHLHQLRLFVKNSNEWGNCKQAIINSHNKQTYLFDTNTESALNNHGFSISCFGGTIWHKSCHLSHSPKIGKMNLKYQSSIVFSNYLKSKLKEMRYARSANGSFWRRELPLSFMWSFHCQVGSNCSSPPR